MPMIYVEDPEEVCSMLAIGDQYFEKNNNRWMQSFFLILPPPYTRKTQIIAADQKNKIHEKIFVTNNHILVQFNKHHVPAKDNMGQV